MGTVVMPLDITAAFNVPSAVFPELVSIAGSSATIVGYAFDGGSTDEKLQWIVPLLNYGSGNITLNYNWYARTASTGQVKNGVRIAAITPNTDTQDVETKSFASQQTSTDTHLGTTNKRLHTNSVTISNLDSAAANDRVTIEFSRVASDTVNDTMSGDQIVTEVWLTYSDT